MILNGLCTEESKNFSHVTHKKNIMLNIHVEPFFDNFKNDIICSRDFFVSISLLYLRFDNFAHNLLLEVLD